MTERMWYKLTEAIFITATLNRDCGWQLLHSPYIGPNMWNTICLHSFFLWLLTFLCVTCHSLFLPYLVIPGYYVDVYIITFFCHSGFLYSHSVTSHCLKKSKGWNVAKYLKTFLSDKGSEKSHFLLESMIWTLTEEHCEKFMLCSYNIF